MKCKYITIEREYGSGGTKIACQLAQQLEIPCYGREILEAVSQKLNIPTKQIDRYEETVTNSFLYSIFLISRAQSGNPDMVAGEGHIYVAEQAAIRQLAANSPCVFLGHCASEALRDRDGVVRVFIRADPSEKRKRILADYDVAESAVSETMKRFDKKRANYYYANTAKRWDDFSNYDIVLNSTQLGIDGCVCALAGLMGGQKR